MDTPYFVYAHGMLSSWFKKKYPLKHFKKWLYWPWATYRVLRDAEGVFFTSEEERRQARESFWLYKCREVITGFGTVSPPGKTENQKNLFLSKFLELKDKRLILFLGRIHTKKGCDILIEAFSKVAQKDYALQLVMAGPDQIGWTAKLKELSEKCGISDRITWCGMLSGDLKWGAYRAADVFILPSHQENFGVSVVEAMACGVPVLISNQIDIWREIVQGDAGFVGNDDLNDTINMLQKWISLPPEEIAKMKVNALQCFIEHFEVHKWADRLIDCLAQKKNS
jgi:glycosyltransferase involved in cell wall biosynthesis